MKKLFVMIILAVISIVLFIFYDKLFDLANFLKQGENLVGLYSSTRNSAVNSIRVLVNCAPFGLYMVCRKKCDINDSAFSTMLNMSLLNIALNIGSMNSIYLHRFCVYTNIFNVMFIPMVLRNVTRENKMIIKSIMLLLYTVFWLYDLYKGSTTVVFHWIFERGYL